MEKQLYLVEYGSADWACAHYHCVVWARSEDEATSIAEGFANEHMADEFRDQYEPDEWEEHDGNFATMVGAELLDEDNEHWKFYNDPTQAEFYPEVV